VRKQRVVLEQVAHAALGGRQVHAGLPVEQRAPADAHMAALRPDEPGDGLQGQRLARARGAEQGQHRRIAGKAHRQLETAVAVGHRQLQVNVDHGVLLGRSAPRPQGLPKPAAASTFWAGGLSR
jgi:hypothetical protein